FRGFTAFSPGHPIVSAVRVAGAESSKPRNDGGYKTSLVHSGSPWRVALTRQNRTRPYNVMETRSPPGDTAWSTLMTLPTQLPAWKALETHYQKAAPLQMRELFRDDPKRFDKFSLRFQDILLDYSKNRITEETMRLL